MKSTNVAKYGETPPSRCCWCLRPSWSGGKTCRECRSVESNLREPVTDAHALTGGRWVRTAGVLRWIADPEQPRGSAECGTDSGYYRHLRVTKTKACLPCRVAHTNAKVERAARARESAA